MILGDRQLRRDFQADRPSTANVRPPNVPSH